MVPSEECISSHLGALGVFGTNIWLNLPLEGAADYDCGRGQPVPNDSVALLAATDCCGRETATARISWAPSSLVVNLDHPMSRNPIW
jgi:hypothetical protein